MSNDKVSFDDGKYTLEINKYGTLSVMRHGQPWLLNPEGSKMLISVIYETLERDKKIQELEQEKVQFAQNRNEQTLELSTEIEVLKHKLSAAISLYKRVITDANDLIKSEILDFDVEELEDPNRVDDVVNAITPESVAKAKEVMALSKILDENGDR